MGTNKNNEAGGNSDNTNASIFNSPIQNFFSGSCILITGATGFVGKALVEKLLRSCPDLRTIYLLIRPKRGLDVQTRHKELLKNPVSITFFFGVVPTTGWEMDENPLIYLHHPTFLPH